MLIAAQVVGTEAVYIYLRDEYHGCRALLQKRWTTCAPSRHAQLPHIELRRGAGAYICGEESAMIESIEGKRGEPACARPTSRRWGCSAGPRWSTTSRPCTGCATSSSAARSGLPALAATAARAAQFQRERAREAPGVKLAPAGITVQELIDEYCGGMLDGHELYAYLPGGASGGILPASA